MRALLASPLGFLIGLSLGALGGGGSILAVPALVLAAGQDPASATTTSLVLVGVAALVGLIPHARAGRLRVGTGITFGLTGVGGSVAGSLLNRHLDPDWLLLGFAAVAGAAAWRMLTGCPTCTGTDAPDPVDATTEAPGDTVVATRLATRQATRRGIDRPSALAVLAAGTGVGLLTGLFGVGGGFVVVPALALVLKLAMPEAIGTSLLVIVINAAVALAARLGTSDIDWGTTLPFVVAAMAGALAGGRVAGRLDARRSLHRFAALLVAVAAATAIRAAVGLAS